MSPLEYASADALARPASPRETAARWAAIALRRASLALARLSRRLAQPARADAASPAPEIEFYAEAGAPEGALYCDGKLVGFLSGVKRL